MTLGFLSSAERHTLRVFCYIKNNSSWCICRPGNSAFYQSIFCYSVWYKKMSWYKASLFLGTLVLWITLEAWFHGRTGWLSWMFLLAYLRYYIAACSTLISEILWLNRRVMHSYENFWVTSVSLATSQMLSP